MENMVGRIATGSILSVSVLCLLGLVALKPLQEQEDANRQKLSAIVSATATAESGKYPNYAPEVKPIVSRYLPNLVKLGWERNGTNYSCSGILNFDPKTYTVAVLTAEHCIAALNNAPLTVARPNPFRYVFVTSSYATAQDRNRYGDVGVIVFHLDSSQEEEKLRINKLAFSQGTQTKFNIINLSYPSEYQGNLRVEVCTDLSDPKYYDPSENLLPQMRAVDCVNSPGTSGSPVFSKDDESIAGVISKQPLGKYEIAFVYINNVGEVTYQNLLTQAEKKLSQKHPASESLAPSYTRRGKSAFQPAQVVYRRPQTYRGRG